MDIPKIARESIEETALLIRRFGARLAGSAAAAVEACLKIALCYLAELEAQ